MYGACSPFLGGGGGGRGAGFLVGRPLCSGSLLRLCDVGWREGGEVDSEGAEDLPSSSEAEDISVADVCRS